MCSRSISTEWSRPPGKYIPYEAQGQYALALSRDDSLVPQTCSSFLFALCKQSSRFFSADVSSGNDVVETGSVVETGGEGFALGIYIG